MKILSTNGFCDFDGFEFMGEKETFLLTTTAGVIECTRDHKFMRADQTWAEAQHLIVGELLYGNVEVLSFTTTGTVKPVYDALNVSNQNAFYAEGMIVHNCNLIYIDEAAFVENWDEFFQSTYPTISSGETTKLLLTSTPNGLNHFWKTCKGAKEGTNGYEYVEVKWDKVPGRGEKWRQETLQALDFDLQKFAQEYEAEFMGSSGTLISGDCLKTLSPMTPILDKDGLKQYFKPEKDHQYAIIADVSRGKGLDYSAFSVIDFTQMPFVQVAVFRDNFIAPTDYASIIHRLSKMYNEAQIMVEINDIGGQVADTLFLDYGSETMLFTENAGAKGKKIAGGFSGRKVDRGIRTTKTVKNIGCSLLKLLIEQKQLLINDYDTIWELSRFSKKGASYEAEPGAHDDVVMGLVLFAWLSNQQFFKDLNDINTIARLRDRTEQEIEEDLLPFGFIDDGSYVSDDVVIEMTPW